MNIIELLRHAAEEAERAGRTIAQTAEDHVLIRVEGEEQTRRIASVSHSGTNVVLITE